MTPEEYATGYLEKHGMIPGHNFVPSTAVDQAALLYLEFEDDDTLLNPRPEDVDPSVPRMDCFRGEL